MPDVQVKMTDSRTIEFQQGLTVEQTEQLGKAIVDAGQNGYKLTGVQSLTGGDQRDQYTVGARLTFRR